MDGEEAHVQWGAGKAGKEFVGELLDGCGVQCVYGGLELGQAVVPSAQATLQKMVDLAVATIDGCDDGSACRARVT